MKCPDCNNNLKKVSIEIEDAETRAISYQCPDCDYYSFEPKSTRKIIKEIKAREVPLKIRQKVIKLSKNRLGIYLNKDIISSLKIKPGEDILVSVPNKNKVVIDICG